MTVTRCTPVFFEESLRSGGVQPIRLPARSPNLNAYAERFVRCIKEECLSRVVPLGEGHLRRLVRDWSDQKAASEVSGCHYGSRGTAGLLRD